jgi:N-acetylglucosamine-6-sulfatase
MRFLPAPRHAGRYEERVIERAPSYGLTGETRHNQPILAAALDLKRTVVEEDPSWDSIVDGGISEETVRRRAEMMLAVDDGVGRILEALEAKGVLDDTLIVFTSDNGYFYGEHGLTVERRLPYEESLRAPLVMRLPGLAEPGTRPAAFALSIDLAPTILGVAGVEIPSRIQGRSLVPVLRGEVDSVRDHACMEYYSHENPMPWTVDLDYRVVREDRFKYIQWTRFEDAEELYDLQVDPYEQINLVLDPERRVLLERMRALVVDCTLEMQGYDE